MSRPAAYSKLDERTVQRLIRGKNCVAAFSANLPREMQGGAGRQFTESTSRRSRKTRRCLSIVERGKSNSRGFQPRQTPWENSPDLVAWCHQSGGIVSPDSKAIYSPPFKNKPYQEQGKALRPTVPVEIGDRIDYRRLAKKREELTLKLNNGWGQNLTDDQIEQIVCARAGLFVSDARELEARALQLPAPEKESA